MWAILSCPGKILPPTSAPSVTCTIRQFIGTWLAEFAVTLTVGFGPCTVRCANVSPVFVTVVDFVATRIAAHHHCSRWWRRCRGGCGGRRCGRRAISITEVTIKLAVLFGPWYITPRTRLSSVVCTVCDRIFTRLAEFAMTLTVDLGPRSVSSAYVTSVLLASFNVLTGIGTGGVSCTHSSCSRCSSDHLSSSMCSCAGIASTVVTEQFAILSGPRLVNT